MGRPIGSIDRQKPFADMLRVALFSGGGRRLRTIADQLCEKAEQGDLQAIQQIADRLDGKPTQALERGDVPVEAISDQQLMAIKDFRRNATRYNKLAADFLSAVALATAIALWL